MSLTKVSYSMINGEVLNVLDFGAVGDNVHDDTNAFKAAITAATTSPTDSRVVYIPNGTYKITDTLVVNKAMSFIGESRFKTILIASGFGVDVPIINFTGEVGDPIQNIRVENFNLWDASGNARGIQATWVNMSQFVNLYFYNLYTGFYGDYCWSNSFQNINAYNIANKTFVLEDQCNNIHFDRVVFTGQIGIEVTKGGANLLFSACDFEGTTSASGSAAYIHPATGKTFVGIVFNGCYFENIKGVAIRLAAVDANAISGVVIKGCYINGSLAESANGVGLSNVNGFDISDNYFYGWQTTAIYRDSTEKNGNIQNNVLVSTPSLTQTSNQASPTVTILNNTYGHQELNQDAAPTTGTYSVGDIVWKTTPAAGGYIGWVCTTAGTPGTWKTFGAISP